MRILSLVQTGVLHSMVTMKATTNTGNMSTQYVPLVDRLPQLADQSKRIFLIRHGETAWNAAGKMQGGGFDIELNDEGKKQAEMVSAELAHVKFGVVVSSHLARAKQTADRIHQELHAADDDAARIVNSDFGEMRFGSFEGLALKGPLCTKETQESYQEWNDKMKLDKTICMPGDGGESVEQVETRARSALQQVLDLGHDYSCIVAHGRTNNILLASLLEGDGQFYYKFRQGNCCINVVDIDETGCATKLAVRYEEHMNR